MLNGFRVFMLQVGLAIGFATLSAPGVSQTVDVSIDGNEAHAQIELTGAVTAAVTIRFEKVVGLSEESLGLSATQVDPLDPGLLGRLPDIEATTVPAGFPLMISVDPPADGGLSFEGVAEIEIYTTALHYAPTTPLRLFKSTNDATFRDITAQLGAGSYRTRGSGGQWSDFLILADTRTLPETVDFKFDWLQQTLMDTSDRIDPDLFDRLQALLDNAWTLWADGDASGAIEALLEFENQTRAGAASGQLPNVWRSARDLDNVDGMLRGGAGTLRFSIGLGGTSPPP